MQQQRERMCKLAPAPVAAQTRYEMASEREANHDVFGPLRRFAPISLGQIGAVALQDRIDTKYLLSAAHLHASLASLAEHYWVPDIDGVRLHPYQTVYFDTNNFALYMRHHDGYRNCCKVRSRQYVSVCNA